MVCGLTIGKGTYQKNSTTTQVAALTRVVVELCFLDDPYITPMSETILR